MAATAYYRQSPNARARSVVTPLSPDFSARMGRVADRSVSRHMSRSSTALAPIHPLANSEREKAERARREGGCGFGGYGVTESYDRLNLASPRSARNGPARMASLEVAQAKPYYNSARDEVYHRYSLKDWDTSNSSYFSLSEKERAQAERLRSDAWRAVKLTDQRTRFRQSEATRKLNERLSDVTFWKSQLMEEVDMLVKEQDMMREHLRILEIALSHTEKPLQIAEECLIHREKRCDIDLVKDDVERGLLKEVASIKKCQEKMKKTVEKAKAQIRMNRAAQHALEMDMKDKTHAQNIDDRVYQMKNNSPELGLYPGIENHDNTLSMPDSWVKFTQENINRSQKCRSASEALRGEIDGLLRCCANEMWSQFSQVNNALSSRVQEVTDARNKLQCHLNRTMQELFDVDKTIHLLRKAIADKEAPLKVAQTRLNERAGRMNVELCNDPAMKTLQQEVNEIRDSIRNLKDQLRTAEVAQARLSKARSMLESNIAVKENSLNIDQKMCLGMRKTFPMDPKSGPVFSMPLTG